MILSFLQWAFFSSPFSNPSFSDPSFSDPPWDHSASRFSSSIWRRACKRRCGGRACTACLAPAGGLEVRFGRACACWWRCWRCWRFACTRGRCCSSFGRRRRRCLRRRAVEVVTRRLGRGRRLYRRRVSSLRQRSPRRVRVRRRWRHVAARRREGLGSSARGSPHPLSCVSAARQRVGTIATSSCEQSRERTARWPLWIEGGSREA